MAFVFGKCTDKCRTKQIFPDFLSQLVQSQLLGMMNFPNIF